MTLFVEALTGIAESIMFYMLYEAFFERKESVSNWFCFICYLINVTQSLSDFFI